MSFSLLPSISADEITQITVQDLQKRGIRLLMLDFDNTIVPYKTNVPTSAVAQWLKDMRDSQIQICIVSNSKKPRVRQFCGDYGIDCITHARKPFSKGIRECLDRYGIPANQAALVGDQIYTDTLGANCAGVTSILVKAIHDHNFWLKSRHCLEIPFRFAARNRTLTR